MQQLFLKLEENKIEPKEKAKDKLNIGDEIRIIRLRPETKKILSYYDRKIDHRKGKIVEIVGTGRDPYQGVKVKFGKRSFEYAFYNDEIRKKRG